MAVKKSELYSSLWASCDKLRGGMDASQYKDYILTLLFIKYVSDRFTGVKYPDITIPPGGGFADLVKLKGDKNIGEGIDKVIAKLAEENRLRGVIDNAHFNDETKLGRGQEMVDKLTGLIGIFQRPELDFSGNRADGDDIIGDAYEYLMRNFATESGKSKGQFYTPAEVSRVLAKVIGIDHAQGPSATVYDPACGSGSLLIRAASEAPFEVAIYGQEKDVSTAGLAKMNLVLHNKATGVIEGNYSTFSDPRYFELNEKGEPTEDLKRFDFVVANPPFSTKNWTDGINGREYGRFSGYKEKPPEKNGDFAWLLHILKSLKEKGKAAVILPHGVLFRGNAEAAIRQEIIKRGYIKGIIGLPANLFYGTGIPACVIVIDMENAHKRQGIFMIDASRGFIKDGNKNRLRERDIYKIVSAFREQREEEKYSRFVFNEEIIDRNGYNLNIPRYIDSSEPDDLQNIDGHLKGGIPNADVDGMDAYWQVFTGLKKVLFSPMREGFYKPNVATQEVRRTVYADKEFSEYAALVDNAFTAWKDKVDPMLRSLSSQTNIKVLIDEMARMMLEAFAPVQLIDKYDAYQVLLSYWHETMADDAYIAAQDGFAAARLTENIVEETKSGKDKGKTKVVGWEGKLLPKGLLEGYFFNEENKAIEANETNVAALQAELDELADSAQGEDEGDEDQETVRQRNALNKEIKEKEKALKALKIQLDDVVKAKYPKLTDSEIVELLLNQKWYRAIYNGINALYTAVSHHMAARVNELAERYEKTLPELEEQAKAYESKVKSHLERMGFEW